MKLNKVQQAAYYLIQEDSRFFYSIATISQNSTKIDSNFVMMSMPYMGVFTYGANQWCNRLGLESPSFKEKEKEFYSDIRLGHKIFEKSYEEYAELIENAFIDSDNYFHNPWNVIEKVFGYYNVGVDKCNDVYCGNTITSAMYCPFDCFDDENHARQILFEYSIIAGKLTAFFGVGEFPPYRYNDRDNNVTYEDYHFFKNSPMKEKSLLGIVLFSILCSINYVISFIDSIFIEEIPQKLKYAYLQYYYLCDFIKDLNKQKNTNFELNTTLKNREFRNCIAHYGLGQVLKEEDVLEDDVLKGLTNKTFGEDYFSMKKKIYRYLSELVYQIESYIF